MAITHGIVAELRSHLPDEIQTVETANELFGNICKFQKQRFPGNGRVSILGRSEFFQSHCDTVVGCLVATSSRRGVAPQQWFSW